MFNPGSRYRNVPQSRHLTAQGERLLSVDLRFIPRVDGSFLHSVRDRERLDLLAFKYYTDPRWWLIADANPDKPFPLDLLNSTPIVEESLTLTHPKYFDRTETLMTNLRGFGQVRRGPFDLFAYTTIVIYTAATTRPLVVDEIVRSGFRLLSSNAWLEGTATAEAFTFSDEAVKQSWNALVAALSDLPGMIRADSTSAGECLDICYNSTQLSREAILWRIDQMNFAIVPQASERFERLGAKIVIPPNQA